MLNQKESVFQAVVSVVGEFEGAVQLTKQQKSEVVQLVTQSMISGDTELSDSARAKYDTDAKVHKYVVGLVNNWLNKDTRLNGGDKYQAKNPGSRAGSSDPVIRELRKLLTVADETVKPAIQQEIDSRLAELAATKTKAVQKEINMDLIPESLKHLVG